MTTAGAGDGGRFRWAVVGTGFAASLFARALGRVPGAELAAVVSRYAERGRAFAAAHGGAAVVTAVDALAAAGGADAVFVATPHHRHAADAIAGLAAGYPVVVEKPFATSAAEAAEVVAAAGRAGRFCMEAMWTRFLPPVRRAAELLRDGRLGDLRLFRADFSGAVDLATAPHLADPAAGGALLDRGVYGISLAVHLLGPVREVRATAHGPAGGPDLTAAVQLTFGSGAVAQVTASIEAEGDNAAVLVGTGGTMQFDPPFYMTRGLTVRTTRPVLLRGPVTGPPSLARRLVDGPVGARLRLLRTRFGRPPGKRITSPFPGSGHQFQLVEAARCIQAGLLESEVMPLADSVETLRVIDLARSGAGGRAEGESVRPPL